MEVWRGGWEVRGGGGGEGGRGGSTAANAGLGRPQGPAVKGWGAVEGVTSHILTSTSTLAPRNPHPFSLNPLIHIPPPSSIPHALPS